MLCMVELQSRLQLDSFLYILYETKRKSHQDLQVLKFSVAYRYQLRPVFTAYTAVLQTLLCLLLSLRGSFSTWPPGLPCSTSAILLTKPVLMVRCIYLYIILCDDEHYINIQTSVTSAGAGKFIFALQAMTCLHSSDGTVDT